MPRQPYLSVVNRARGTRYDIGTHCIGQRPELEKLIGACVMSWPFIEAEMAVLLGVLLKADNPAALAVFQSLRRSSAQRDAIAEAAKVALNERDQELLGAILSVHKATEAERNALVHGHFGTADNLPDAFIWQNTTDYVLFRASMTISREGTLDDARVGRLLSTMYVYRKADLEAIFAEISELAQVWHDLTRYLTHKLPADARVHGQAYSQLCGQSRIAQELENIRRKNNPSVQPPSPRLEPSG